MRTLKAIFSVLTVMAVSLAVISNGVVNAKGNPNAIQYTLEAYSPVHGWTTGNPCQGNGGCYTEGETVPTRLTVSNLDPSTHYVIYLQHEYVDNFGTIGYVEFNRNGIVGDTGAINIVLLSTGQVPCGAFMDCINYNLEFDTDANSTSATIYWNSILGDEAADWKPGNGQGQGGQGNGANLHLRLTNVTGNHEIPIQVEDNEPQQEEPEDPETPEDPEDPETPVVTTTGRVLGTSTFATTAFDSNEIVQIATVLGLTLTIAGFIIVNKDKLIRIEK